MIYTLMKDGTYTNINILPKAESGEVGRLDTEKYIYQFCGGDYNGKLWKYPALEVRNIIAGYNPDKKKQRAVGMLVYREELDNQPIIKGYCGPMYNGIDRETGKHIIRYESVAVNRLYD